MAIVTMSTEGNPFGYAFGEEQHNLFRSADGHIHALWFNFQDGWHHEDRTAMLPGAPPAVGDPFGYAFAEEQHNLFRSKEGDIHALWFTFEHGWHHEVRVQELRAGNPQIRLNAILDQGRFIKVFGHGFTPAGIVKLGYDIASGGGPVTHQTGEHTITSDEIGSFIDPIEVNLGPDVSFAQAQATDLASGAIATASLPGRFF